ncbi:hypothetical protein [Candidatus Methanodesulfokora washburnensis]|uniref:Uncharacterized protein n=1 Tax=Candidatus Methanodesulfokora washburnensis TaxID=2478471 RepID=A0A3R9PCB2_9CREN|nr:hypothetical protein [Candidatus Methanodesulfokores washburnensis]RSN72445.1 hypothetical protein D6D85_13825 [Candidatus Methanodesulfokores washburnensis]
MPNATVATNQTVQQLAEETLKNAVAFIKSLNSLIKAVFIPLFVRIGVQAWIASWIIDIAVFLLFIWMIRSTTGKVKLLLILLLIWFAAGIFWGAEGFKWSKP